MNSTVLILAGLTLVLALGGGFLPLFGRLKGDPDRLRMTTGIAAGILLASAMIVVIPEGFELASEEHEEEVGPASGEHEEGLGHLTIGGTILAGFLMMLILEGMGSGHAIHEEHHDHSEEHGHGHVHHQASPWMLVTGLSLHSAADGLAIGAAAASSGASAVTALVAFAVIVHKVPAAFSLGVFALHERNDRNAAIKDVVLFSLATPVMILVAFFVFDGVEEHLIGLAMLFAAGTFLYVATVDTLPDIHNPETGKKALIHVLIGAIILTGILIGADTAGLIDHSH